MNLCSLLLETVLLGASFFLFYALICHAAFRRLQHALAEESSALHSSQSRYLATQKRLSILALLNLAIDVYVWISIIICKVSPDLKQSLTLPGMAVLGLLLVHLAVMWFWSYPIYRHIYHSSLKPWAFLKGNLAFSFGILVPWFLLSMVSDVLEVLKTPAILKTEAGQFAAHGGHADRLCALCTTAGGAIVGMSSPADERPSAWSWRILPRRSTSRWVTLCFGRCLAAKRLRPESSGCCRSGAISSLPGVCSDSST